MCPGATATTCDPTAHSYVMLLEPTLFVALHLSSARFVLAERDLTRLGSPQSCVAAHSEEQGSRQGQAGADPKLRRRVLMKIGRGSVLDLRSAFRAIVRHHAPA